MASLRQTNSTFIVCFRLGGRHHQRSLKTGDRRRAETLLGEIEGRLGRLALGEKSLPPGVDAVDYVLTGNDQPPPEPEPPAPPQDPIPSLEQATETFLTCRQGVKADSTVVTERIHLKNITKEISAIVFGAAASSLVEIDATDFDRALHARKGRVSTTTISKERQTLVSFLRWTARRWNLPHLANVELTQFPKEVRDDPFRTVAEVEEEIARGGQSATELVELWSKIYLTPEEVAEVLGLVRERAKLDFVPVMHEIAAHTGLRRGEILRLKWADLDLSRGTLVARSLKQSRSRRVTTRSVDLHSRLAETLRCYKADRPRGQFVITLPSSTAPLTADQSNQYFRRPLKKTRWEKVLAPGQKKVVLGWHTYRHSFASNLAAAGVSQAIIDSLMGHQTAEMRLRYQHLRPSVRRSAVEQLGYGSIVSAQEASDDAA